MHRVHSFRPQELTDSEIELFERLTRRRFLIGAGSLVLAGCGGPGASAPTATVTATRRVAHALGETDVPVNPQRIYVFTIDYLDQLLALDFQPIGTTVRADPALPAWLVTRAEGITQICCDPEPGLEAIVELQPDLILGGASQMEAVYNELSAIAPAIAFPDDSSDWRDEFRLVASTLERGAEAEQFIAAYNDRVEMFRRQVDADVLGSTVAFVYVQGTQIRVYGAASLAGSVLADAGFQVITLETERPFLRELSLERIPELDAHYILFSTNNPDSAILSGLVDSALWQQLEAVRNDRVLEITPGPWLTAGPIGIRDAVLPELFMLFGAT